MLTMDSDSVASLKILLQGFVTKPVIGAQRLPWDQTEERNQAIASIGPSLRQAHGFNEGQRFGRLL